jgi:glucose-6-phosphate isomerase
MLPKINPTTTRAWQLLKQHFSEMELVHMRELFRIDHDRFEKYSIRAEDILFDYSKNIITEKTRKLLLQLAEECKLGEAIEAMFNGDMINGTEKRSVLHVALRDFSGGNIYSEGIDVMPAVRSVQEKMKLFCNDVHNGTIRGYTGKRIKYIVNIGIGGSDLGPQMVTEALKPYWLDGMQAFFVSNVDASHLAETLKQIKPERTLFLVASKTFTTQETMTNAHTARRWFLRKAKHEKHISRHFIALSTNEAEVRKFGISEENIFGFWDWVGGRFSLWSAIGLSIALTIGYDKFEELLKGAHHSDKHFRYTELSENIPVMMGLLGIWYTNFFGAQSETVLPYDQYMHRFPAYLQQASMESNGKTVDRSGEPVNYATGPVIWGEPGTNGQHAFFQLLHQGTLTVPCDFIAPAISHKLIGDHHHKLLSNFFAQTEALMKGRNEEEVQQQLDPLGLSHEEVARQIPYKIFPGNKPSNTFLIKKITPFTLGQLIALYEHKVFVQGIIWNIYSFDQWGVELGKQLAGTILNELASEENVSSHDASTNGLLSAFRQMGKGS